MENISRYSTFYTQDCGEGAGGGYDLRRPQCKYDYSIITAVPEAVTISMLPPCPKTS